MKDLRGLIWVSSLGVGVLAFAMAGCSSSSSNSKGNGSGGAAGSAAGGAGGTAAGGTGGTAMGGAGGTAMGGTGGAAGGAGGTAAGGAGGTAAGGAGGSGGCGNGMVALTVKNYQSWCSFSVTPSSGVGITDFSGPETTVCVDPGSVDLSATALSGFILGSAPWHDTDGDTGSGDPGTVTGSGQSAKNSTTETVGSSNDCVWVCCPFTNGSGCPTTDQCP